MKYSIVIPVFNEAGKITNTLTQVVTFMREFSEAFEVVVVDDGSSDESARLIEESALENPEIILIKNPHKGKGPTVHKGIMHAQGDLIYMCDADLAAPISEIKRLTIWITDQDYDIVIASREGQGAQRVDEPFYRHLMGRIFNYWVQLIALPGIQDSQCGFKLFRKDTAKKVFSALKVYGNDAKVINNAYLGAFDVEVIYLAKKLGYQVKELPVKWTYVKTTRLNPVVDSIKMVKDVFLVRIYDLLGRYS